MATTVPKPLTTSARAWRAAGVAVVLGSGLGDFAERLTERVSIAYDRHPALARLARRRPRGQARRRAGRAAAAWRRWPGARTSTRATTCDGDVRDARARAARREDAAAHQRRRRHQHFVRAGRADADDDHINLMGSNPLVGANERALRPALPGHDRGRIRRGCARSPTRRRARAGVPLEQGVYVAVHGPSYETPAEIRASCARSAPTPSACRRCRKRSSRGTWGSRCSASRASRTWPRACCRSRSSTTR